MAKIIQNEIEYFSSKQINIDKQTESASVISYDNTNSGLEARNIQDAVDELAGAGNPTGNSIMVKEIDGESIYISNTISGDMAVMPTKNLIYYNLNHIKGTNGSTTSWSDNIYTGGGMTITFNRDGSVTLNGTNTTGDFMYIDFFDSRSNLEENGNGQVIDNFMNLKRNTAYTLSCKEIEDQVGKIHLITNGYNTDSNNDNLGNIFLNMTETGNKPHTVIFNPPSDMIYMTLFMHIYPNATFNNLTIRPMLEEGTVAHNWVPPTGYDIVSVNKNIYTVDLSKNNLSLETGSWNKNRDEFTVNSGVTISFPKDTGTIVFDGTLSLTDQQFILFPFFRLDTLRKLNISENNQYVFMLGANLPENCYIQYSNYSDGSIDSNNNYIVLNSMYDMNTYPAQAICLYIPNRTVFDNVILRPMLIRKEDFDSGNTNFVMNRFKEINVNFFSDNVVYGLESYDGVTNILDSYNSYKKVSYAINTIGNSILSSGEAKNRLSTVFNLKQCPIENYIAENTDFNNITEAGQYTVFSNSIAETCLNTPSNNSGNLVVTNSIGRDFSADSYAFIIQTYFDFTNVIYSRYIFKGATNEDITYQEWKKIAFEEAIEQVTTLATAAYTTLVEKAAVVIKDVEFASLEEFVETTDTKGETDNANGKFVIFDDTTGWGPTGTANVNYRGYVIYQNYYGDDITDSVNGNVTLYIDNNSYTGIISGNKTDGVSVTWEKIINSTDLDELKKSVSDGKTLVADAITAKGVETATDATFATMAANIASINSNLNKITQSCSGTTTLSASNFVDLECGFKPKALILAITYTGTAKAIVAHFDLTHIVKDDSYTDGDRYLLTRYYDHDKTLTTNIETPNITFDIATGGGLVVNDTGVSIKVATSSFATKAQWIAFR